MSDENGAEQNPTKAEEEQYKEELEQEESENKVSGAVSVPEGSVAYSGDVNQLLERKTTDPQIICPTDAWSYQPLNAGIRIPPFIGDPVEFAKIQPPKVLKTLEQRKSELSEKEVAALDLVRTHCDSKSYTNTEVDDWMILRYLAARNFDAKKAGDMLDATMKWRAEKTVESSLCQKCRSGRPAHCMEFMGWDLEHRPVLYGSYKWALERGGLQNDLSHVVDSYDHLESKMITEGVTQWVALTDFVTYGHWRDGKDPRMAKQMAYILQNHYPERLGLQVLIDPPTSFWLLWKMLTPFIDARTRSKVKFWYSTKQPNTGTEFPQIFPPHLSEWLLQSYAENKK